MYHLELRDTTKVKATRLIKKFWIYARLRLLITTRWEVIAGKV